MMSPENVWSQAKDRLPSDLVGTAREVWIHPLRPLRLDGTTLVLGCPNEFFKSWVEDHYAGPIREAVGLSESVVNQVGFEVSPMEQPWSGSIMAISVRQPWAWLILNGGKLVENRSWETSYRGPLALHAASRLDRASIDQVRAWMTLQKRDPILPEAGRLPRGGIVGLVDLVDCRLDSGEDWGMPGHWHWILKNPRPVCFAPFKGRLGLFHVPRRLIFELKPGGRA